MGTGTRQGRLVHWNDDRGFGFIEPEGGGGKAFVHIKSFPKGALRPVEGDMLVYEGLLEANGKIKAVNVRFARKHGKSARLPWRKRPSLGTLIVLSFCLVLVIATFVDKIPLDLFCLYIGVSIWAFLAYAYDKSAAQNHRWRTSEAHLYFLGLIGGWPGAYCAQKILRHKSSKKEFQQVYWLTVFINISVFVWLFSKQGQQLLAHISISDSLKMVLDRIL